MDSPHHLSVRVVSGSHVLNSAAFALLTQPEASLQVHDVQERSFTATVVESSGIHADLSAFLNVAHNCHGSFLIALNIATIGRFYWERASNVLAPYRLSGGPHSEEEHNVEFLPRLHQEEAEAMTREDVSRTALAYGALARGADSVLRSDYIKGIVHFHLDVRGADFLRDSFANFYRCLEKLVTSHVLGKKKLANELREIQSALVDIGLDKGDVEELRDLYMIWSEQIMHSQRIQRSIDVDDVLKVKALADYVWHHVLRSVWESEL